MRPRVLGLAVTLGIFACGLAVVWFTGGGGSATSGQPRERVFTFPLNSSTKIVTVRSPWKLGHMTPQDDEVELTLDGRCATAHLYAYLSTNWDQGPLGTAAVILGTPLHPAVGAAPRIVRHDRNSAVVLSLESGRGVLVTRAAPRDFDTLVVDWHNTGRCTSAARTRAARELARLFDTFRVGVPGTTVPASAALEVA